MKLMTQLLAVALVTVGLLLSACSKSQNTLEIEHPAVIEQIEGSDLSKVTLTERAIQRLDLKTEQVLEMKVERTSSMRKVVPYSSLIYDPQGQTWVYTSPQPETFIRHKVDVDYIEGNLAVLNEGPPTGTVVASIGVAELYGAEFKVGH